MKNLLTTKKHLLKFSRCFLVVILSVLLIFNMSVLPAFQAEAVVPVVLAVPVILVLGAAMIACGFSFANAKSLEHSSGSLWNSLSAAGKAAVERVANDPGIMMGRVGIELLAEEWGNIFDGITKCWGTQVGVTMNTNITQSLGGFSSAFLDGSHISFPINVNASSICSYTVKNAVFKFIGKDRLADCYDFVRTNYELSSKLIGSSSGVTCFKVGATGLECFVYDQIVGRTEFSFYLTNAIDKKTLNYCSFKYCEPTYYYNYYGAYTSILSYNGMQLQTHLTGSSFFYPFTITFADGTNIVQNGRIGAYEVPGSICPDGVWNSIGAFTSWICGQSFGINIPGIDAGNSDEIYYPDIAINDWPGIDSWPRDETGAMPARIPLSIPGSIEAALETTTEMVRDVATDTTGEIPIDPGTGTGTGTLPKGVPSLTIPEVIFKEKFPFCLPWDIYNLFAGMQANSTPPKFSIPFEFNRLGINYSIDIDFSDFESQIAIIRFFLGAGFVLALILISRKMIGSE